MNNQTDKQRIDFIGRREKALAKINEILQKYSITLAPYLNYSEGSIKPTIKVVDAKVYKDEQADNNTQKDEPKKNKNKQK